jgi:cellulose synthase/poly-beta-1,6-N-acetylglucosamine synthase-like glycosyltransferase
MPLVSLLIDVLLFAAAALIAVPSTVFLLEVLLARAGRPAAAAVAPTQLRPSVAVLVPAHDESGGIAEALATVVPQLATGDRLLVVADNCSDDTAAVARAAGAEVVERDDPCRRGKGYALDFGVRALAGRPPQVVVVMDADCALEPDAIDRLAKRCAEAGRPVQALYLMHGAPGAGLRVRLAEFAWVVRNHVRPLGLARCGLPCQLMGTGMAFLWQQLRTAPLASSHLVEDMQLGIDLAIAGAAPLFCPQARVHSVFASQVEAVVSQRTRWEHGHLSVIGRAAPRLFWQALRQGRLDLLAMALDLCVPPLAALLLLALALALLCGVAAAFGAARAPLLIVLYALLAITVATLLARRRFAAGIVSAADLLAVPGYVLGKLPIYARFLRRRQIDWIRTKRGDGPS